MDSSGYIGMYGGYIGFYGDYMGYIWIPASIRENEREKQMESAMETVIM